MRVQVGYSRLSPKTREASKERIVDFPTQFSGPGKMATSSAGGGFGMRDWLSPRRLTMVMWDQAFLLRHIPGGSYENFDKVLDETIERGYNTLRLDPMPQWLDLSKPETVLWWPDPKQPYMPWGWNTEVEGPVGEWLIEFMEKVQARGLHYTLSAWWFGTQNERLKMLRYPKTHTEAAEIWVTTLEQWKRRFGFEGLVYVDITNEIPYFLGGFCKRFEQDTGGPWDGPAVFTSEQVQYLTDELNPAIALLQKEFPELRFTGSIHGDTRWLTVPVEFDCLDVHFYSDADNRWNSRTRFREFMKILFTDASWRKEFNDRCTKTHKAMAPMLRARQRQKLAQFAAWAEQKGMPLTTTESWSSWYYFDSPDLDWGWLLDWAEWSVEDAIEFGMWGWTPHNYCQPQFRNWKDVKWHQRLTSRFLRS